MKSIKEYKTYLTNPSKPINETKYIRFFCTTFLFGLNTPGIKVLCYILDNLSMNQDYVYIPETECMKYCGYKGKSNLYKGIASLLELEVLFKKVGNSSEYFINTNYIKL